MYWTWYTILLFILAVLLAAYGLFNLYDGEGSGFLFLLAFACAAAPFVTTYSHTIHTHNRSAKQALQKQGFDVANVDTTGHDVTIIFGACTRDFKMDKRQGVWQLLAKQPNGELRIFLPEQSKDIGRACQPVTG